MNSPLPISVGLVPVGFRLVATRLPLKNSPCRSPSAAPGIRRLHIGYAISFFFGLSGLRLVRFVKFH